MSDQRLFDSALNTIMMVSFAVPGGAPVGVLSAVAMFLGKLLPSPPPAPGPVSASQLRAALDDLKSEILNGFWKSETDHNVSTSLALNDGFQDTWANMRKLQVDGQRYVLATTDTTIAQWVQDTERYFDVTDPNGVLTTVRRMRNDLTDTSLLDPSLTAMQVAEHSTRSTGVFCLIGSLSVAYLQAAVAWKWGNELLVAWQYQEYQKDVDHWTSQSAAYQIAHPLSSLQQKYPGLNTSSNYSPPTWNAWVNEPGCPVPELLQEVQTMVEYAVQVPDDGNGPKPGLYTKMLKDWDDLETKVASYDAFTPPNADAFLYLQNAVATGTARALAWYQLSQRNALGSVTEENLTKFGQCIDAWRAAAAQVSFVTYTVLPGDTLASIAKSQSAQVIQIRAAKGDPSKTLSDPVTAGVDLKVFTVDALPYLASPAGGTV